MQGPGYSMVRQGQRAEGRGQTGAQCPSHAQQSSGSHRAQGPGAPLPHTHLHPLLARCRRAFWQGARGLPSLARVDSSVWWSTAPSFASSSSMVSSSSSTAMGTTRCHETASQHCVKHYQASELH